MSEGKLEKIDKGFNAVKSILAGIIMIAIGAGVIVILINAFSNNKDDGEMSITEAQKKCVVLTMVGYQKATGEEQNVKDAQDHCLAMWDSPEREKSFKEYITKEWDNNKDEVFNGKTIETIYEERKASL